MIQFTGMPIRYSTINDYMLIRLGNNYSCLADPGTVIV